MSRLLDKLKEYDESYTVADLIKELEKDENSAKEKEAQEIEKVKSEFENTYLKYLDKKSLYGIELIIVELKSFVRKERTTDWSLTYYFEGSEMSFSKRSFYCNTFNPKNCSNSFSAEKLRGMEKITKEEYEKYRTAYLNLEADLIHLIQK